MKEISGPRIVFSRKGFTLIELMIAMAITGIVLAALTGIFVRSNRLYTTENAKAALQQEIRAALAIMSREIRMATYDPHKTGDFTIINASAPHLHYSADLDEDGTNDPAPSWPDCETLSFRFSAGTNAVQMICGEGTGAMNVETLIGAADTQVTALNFAYRDFSNNPTTFIPDMRGVVVTLTAEAPAGRDGMITRTYETWVDFRNAAPNAAN